MDTATSTATRKESDMCEVGLLLCCGGGGLMTNTGKYVHKVDTVVLFIKSTMRLDI